MACAGVTTFAAFGIDVRPLLTVGSIGTGGFARLESYSVNTRGCSCRWLCMGLLKCALLPPAVAVGFAAQSTMQNVV